MWIDPEPAAPPLLVRDGSADEIETGSAVRFEVERQGITARASEATVVEFLGSADNDGTRMKMAVANLTLPNQFPQAVLEMAEQFEEVDVTNADGGRRDLRERLHVTIDGEHARDFDDAISAEKEQGSYRVWISIADVAFYVTARTVIDKEAKLRGTSVYLPTQVLPMLPERLSNGLCSLVPGEPRYTLTCEMLIDADGKRSDISIYPSLICSAARLTYTQVQTLIDGESGVPENVSAVVQTAIKASSLLRKRRFGAGSLDLDIPEAQVIFNEAGEPTNIIGSRQLPAHQVIEDLMISANESVAEFLLDQRLVGVFRIHPPPPPEKWMRLVDWAKRYGLPLNGDHPKNPKGLSRFLSKLKQTRQADAGQMMLLRSLSQASYSAQCEMHFGLASEAYAHFTSPIRRYPDLLVHRALWNYWKGKPTLKGLDKLAESSSEAERAAVVAEREVTHLAGCLVARKRVGEEMTARIVGVHFAGLFVRPDELFVEGLVPIGQLSRGGGDYFELREDAQAIVGRNSNTSYGLGDQLKVRLAEVNLGTRRINFELAGARTSTGSSETGNGEGDGPQPVRKRRSAKSRPAKKSRGSAKSSRTTKTGTKAPGRGQQGKRGKKK